MNAKGQRGASRKTPARTSKEGQATEGPVKAEPEDVATHTYLIYDAKTGDLVHGHKAVLLPDGDTPGEGQLIEDALGVAAEATGRKADELKVMEVKEEELEPGVEYKVDPKTEQLKRAGSKSKG